MHVLCIARHRLIGEHLARVFARVGAMTDFAVGLADGAAHALESRPNVIVCEYDLLATLPLGAWENDEPLSHLPMIAVSLTRRPGEVHPLDVNNVSGFIYLPGLSDEKAHQLLEGAARSIVRAPAISPLAWTGSGHTPTQQPV